MAIVRSFPRPTGILGVARWLWTTIPRRIISRSINEAQAGAPLVSLSLAEEFERFFRQHEPQVYGYLRRLTGEEEGAYDLTQEAFLRAWQHFAEVCEHPNSAAWLFRVATNLALKYLRRRSAPVGAATPFDDDLATNEHDFSVSLVESALVRETLLCLPPRQRALLVLREVYGLSLDEAAEALDMSEAAARKALWRARQQFRDCYTRKDGQR